METRLRRRLAQFTQDGPAGSDGIGGCGGDDWKPSASELQLFQPLNGFALVGDNLRLPNERDRHEAHGDDAEDEDETEVGLLSGEPKCTPKPSHGRGSPSTRSARSLKK